MDIDLTYRLLYPNLGHQKLFLVKIVPLDESATWEKKKNQGTVQMEFELNDLEDETLMIQVLLINQIYMSTMRNLNYKIKEFEIEEASQI